MSDKMILEICLVITVFGFGACVYQLREARKHSENMIDICKDAVKSIKFIARK